MKESLLRGTTLIVDRYAYSGVAFTAAKKVISIYLSIYLFIYLSIYLSSSIQVASLDWCKGPDRGLPAPDVVLYLQLSSQVAQNRSNYGDERYEKTSFQDVSENKTDKSYDHF